MPVPPRGLSAVLLGLGVGWGAGNVGPVAISLTHSFRVSLTAVGLLSGTAYFAAIAVATPLVVPLAARVGVVRATGFAAAAMSAGHILFAVSPAFAGLLAARITVGAGSGLALVAGPVMARELGGVRLVGLLGGAISLGIALALGLGSALQDSGTTWRADFVISAAVCALPLAVLPPGISTRPVPLPEPAFVKAASRTGAFWRLAALFLSVNGVPLIVSAWLLVYLTRQEHVSTPVAGGLAFVLFGLTTVVRPLGARLARGKLGYVALAAGGSIVAAAGLVALAASPALIVASLAVVLMGTGFALPYAPMIDAVQRLFTGQAAATLALIQTGPNVVPMVVIPLVGSALGSRYAPWAFLLLAAFVAAAGLANLRKPPADAPGSK